MVDVISCLVLEHDYLVLSIALLVCGIGSLVTMRLFARTRRTTGSRKAHWLFVSSVASGSTIWTTHFLAMIAYQTQLAHVFDPVATVMSLFVSILVSLVGFTVAAVTRHSPMIELGGIIVGLGIAVMHYLGVGAYKVAGTIEWEADFVIASLILGAVFGGIAVNRIARPLSPYCIYGGIAAFFLAIVSMHSTGMTAMNIVADPMISVPEKMMSDGVLITGVVGFMMLVFGSGFSINILDNKQREEAEQYYHHLSHHDALTGLPHQNFTMRNIEHKIQLADAGHAGMAIFMIGLSGLREIRNVHGQAASDSIFKEIASRLMALCGEGEILSRGRGDTLVAIMPVAQSKGQVHAFTERLRLGFADPVIEGGKSLVVDMLCGIALFPSDGTKDRDLLGHAELALARAEQSPNRKIVFYEPDIDENSRSRSALAIELRYAIEREELELHYQPQTDVDSGRLIGFEALLRWNHPEFGAVSPVDFIPIAEETGLILPIGEWVLKTACGAAAAWKYPYKIAVNVAPQQLATGSLPASVLAILSETGLAPSRLELEITETSIIRDHFHTLNMVRELKHLGISIAMDDFGTGYSSLSMLQSFPFDKIKIDRSFISGVAGNPQSAAIARAVIVLAQGLRIRILAEGVEDQEDLDFLQREGCHEAQGYFFGRPMPLAEIRNIANAPPEAFAGVAQTGKIFHLFPQGN